MEEILAPGRFLPSARGSALGTLFTRLLGGVLEGSQILVGVCLEGVYSPPHEHEEDHQREGRLAHR